MKKVYETWESLFKRVQEKSFLDRKWYASIIKEDQLLYAFLNAEMLNDPERLSNSVLSTFDMLYSFDSPLISSYEVATTRALFSKMERCFLVNKKEGDFGLVELEKDDNIPKYLNELLEEHGFEIKRIQKGKITEDVTERFFVPAYFIQL